MPSNLHKLLLFASLSAAVGGVVALRAQGGEQRVAPEEFRWPANTAGGLGTSGASGVQTLVVKGDPSKPGLYTIRLRIAPNTKIQAHSHPDDRVATVVSGTWYFGYGHEFNEAALKALPPGSFYTEPPGVDHFAMTRDQVVVEITGVGPTGTTYFDPRNDPTKRH